MTDLHETFEESQAALFDDLRRKRAAAAGAKPDRLLQFFQYDHLPEMLKDASAPFCHLARIVVDTYPANAERTICLRKLLEAKDAAVRTMLDRET